MAKFINKKPVDDILQFKDSKIEATSLQVRWSANSIESARSVLY